MRSALVGATGFVGGNLRSTRHFTDEVGSLDSHRLAGQHYDRVVFAAARAEKWRINQDPDTDARHIAQLQALLGTFTTEQLVLVSTVDVYAAPVGVYEDTPVLTDDLHPYGLHRFQLEQFARATHPTTVLRLPGLFGAGLKKNVIFDLLHGNNVDRIHRAGSFQYYNLAHLADDIDLVVSSGIDLVNLATEPIRTDDLAREAFGLDFTNEPEGVSAGRYDMRTRHASLFGESSAEYAYSRTAVLDDLRRFVSDEAR